MEMRRYKLLLVLGLALALALGLTACGGDDGLPGKTTLATMLPEELYNYSLDFEEYTAKLADINILRQQLDGKTCITECEAIFADENITRREYLRLTMSFWDKGGWDLESWDIIQAPEYAPAVSFGEELFLSEIVHDGYRRESLTRLETHDGEGHVLEELEYLGLIDNTETQHCVSYRINDTLENVTISGALIAEARLSLESKSSFPRTFYWSTDVDDRYCSYDWNISGNWHCDFTDGGVDHTLDAELELRTNPGALGIEFLYGVEGRVTIDGADERLFVEGSSGYNSYYQFDYYPQISLVMELHPYRDGTCYRIVFYPTYAEMELYKDYDGGTYWDDRDYEGSYDFKRV